MVNITCTILLTAPPSNTLSDFITAHDSFDSSGVLLTWTVLPLDQAKGFITLSITFGPLALANVARGKRQAADECSQSPCLVSYEQGRATITGLDPQQDHFIIAIPENEEGEIGTPSASGIPAVIEQQSCTRKLMTLKLIYASICN